MDQSQHGHAAEDDSRRYCRQEQRAADLEFRIPEKRLAQACDGERVEAGDGQRRHTEFQGPRQREPASGEAKRKGRRHERAIARAGRMKHAFKPRDRHESYGAEAGEPERPGRVADEPAQAGVGTEECGDRQRHRPGRGEILKRDAAALLHSPQADRGARCQRPENPDGVVPGGQREGQGERRPQGEQLPGVGAARIDLADQREQAADGGCRYQQRGDADTWRQSARERRDQQQASHKLQLRQPVKRRPVGGDPAEDAEGEQAGRADGGQRAQRGGGDLRLR